MTSQILNNVRKSLLQEAKESPKLLSDLAGLEKYIAESYSSRSFIELLQNADDASSKRILIRRVQKHIIVANDGHKFSELDFESLCRSAASKKERQTSIGFRGIGFKSVVGFAKQIHIISGELEVTFCRKLTSQLIPQADSVPLVRIPHPIDKDLRILLASEIENLFNNNYTSIFIFSDLIANFVENEFECLDPTALLFLKNVNEINIGYPNALTYAATRNNIDKNTSSVDIIINNNDKQTWTIFYQNNISIAAQKHNNKYIKLQGDTAVVHAFLPTAEETGFGFKVNGNINTDPSRLRVIFDDSSMNIINKIAKLYIVLIKQCLDPKNSHGEDNLIEPLMPLFDPRMVKFQKNSFQKEFILAISKVAEQEFDDFYRRPSWLNPFDSETLANHSKINIPPRNIGEIIELDSLLKLFNVKEIPLEKLSLSLKENNLTKQGAAEVVSYLTKQNSTKQISISMIDKKWKIWSVNNVNLSLYDVIKNKNVLDTDFIDLVTEKVGVFTELNRLISAITDTETANIIVPKKEIPQIKVTEIYEKEEFIPSKSVSLIKWRSAEQQILEILNSDGWTAKDVSRQNIGYDIEAINPTGKTLFIEVKSLQYEGQSFSLTSNEEATARDKGKSYLLALVLQKKEQLQVMFIENPLTVITLERQCKQWVWLCSSYNFPQKFMSFNRKNDTSL